MVNKGQLQELIEQGYITARRHPTLPLAIYNYTPKCQYEPFWCEETLMCRGLIMSDDGEVIARPFDKFFNWGERGQLSTAEIVTVTEKMDGSLGILYHYDGQTSIATRGSFDSEQALWATEFLNRNYDLDELAGGITLLFEIIYPDNRIVVDYKGKEDLVLLAARDRFNGRFYPWSTVQGIAGVFGFSLPTVYRFDTPQDILNAAKNLDPNSEGWVVEFADGQRFKFKGESYVELHRLISNLSFRNTLECIASGTLKELLEVVPDEFLDQVNNWISQINNKVLFIREAVETNYLEAPKTSRKDYALWVQANCKDLAPYMFYRLDGRDIDELIYKYAFKDLDSGQSLSIWP